MIEIPAWREDIRRWIERRGFVMRSGNPQTAVYQRHFCDHGINIGAAPEPIVPADAQAVVLVLH